MLEPDLSPVLLVSPVKEVVGVFDLSAPLILCRKPSLDERKKKHCDIFSLSLALAASLLTARMAVYTRWGATQTGIHMAKLSSGLHSVWY